MAVVEDEEERQGRGRVVLCLSKGEELEYQKTNKARKNNVYQKGKGMKLIRRRSRDTGSRPLLLLLDYLYHTMCYYCVYIFEKGN